MSNATAALVLKPYGKGGRPVTLPVGVYAIKGGTMVAQLAAGSYLCPGSTASSGPAVGVATHDQDNSAGSAADLRCAVLTDQVFVFANSVGDPCAETTAFGAIVYMEDDHTISKTNGGSQFAAGYFFGMEPDGNVRVYIASYRISPADLTTLATSAGAGDIGILDAGSFTAQTTVEAALAELYQTTESIQSRISLGLPVAALDAVTGAPMLVFANSSNALPGVQVANSKAPAVRWNNHAAPTAIAFCVDMPQDLDDTAVITYHALVSKSGATSGDALSLTVNAYEQTVGALHDADTDFGGTTSAVSGAATAKTVTEVILTLAAADVHAAPSAMSFFVAPTAGTLGTDDAFLHAHWLEYKRKVMTS